MNDASRSAPEPRVTVGPPEKTALYAWYVAAMLSVAYLLSIMDRFLLSVVLDDVKRDLALTDTQLGVLQGPSFVLLFLIASIPLGRLADTSSRRLIIFVGLTCWSVATLACGLATTYGGLLAGRLGVGLGEAALLPCAMSLIVAYFSRDKLNRGISVYSMGGSFGRAAAFAGGGALFGYLGSVGGFSPWPGLQLRPWQGVFVAAGIAGIVIAVWFLLTVREPPRARTSGPRPGYAEGFRFFWANRRAYLAVFMPFAMSSAAAMQLASWSVAFYRRTFDMPVPRASAIIGITGLIFGPLGHLFGGWINDFFRQRGVRGPQPLVLAAVTVFATLFIGLFTFAPSVDVAVGMYAIAYFALCAAGPSGFGGVQLPTPDSQRGFMSSIFLLFFTAIGTGLSPYAVGWMSDEFFPQKELLGRAMIWTSVLFTLVGLPFALFGHRAFTAAVVANEDRSRS